MGIQAPSALTQVTIIEKKTNQILMPIFKTSWAIGAMIAAIISSISLWLNIDALKHFFILGIIAILAIVFIKIYGLKKNYDVINKNPKLSFPTLNTFLFGSISTKAN